MNLLDALFLDPAPFDYFCAYRSDSLPGTGTLNDPLNCSTQWEPARAVTSLTNSGQEATATVSPVQGLANGDVVTVAGVIETGPSQWNGTFAIYSLNSGANTFKFYMTGVPPDPATGTMTAAKVV